MNTTEIIKKVNELTLRTFTEMFKIKINAEFSFLIIVLKSGGSIYGSYNSTAIYYIDQNGNSFGFR